MRIGAQLILAASLLVLSQTSLARDTFHDLSVDAALHGPDASALRDVKVFMQGQDHPAVAQKLGDFTSNRSTNAFNKSDEAGCARAFVSAIIALQDRATSLGGNAVIDIKSITRHNDLVSATDFRCVAGTFSANVALSGTVVKLK